MRSVLFSSFLLGAIPYVSAHGHITSPPIRAAGAAFKASCGEQVSNTVTSDINGNVQQLQQVSQGQKDFNPANCTLNLCKGLQAADNQANVQSFTAGQVLPLTAVIEAPHTGVMNVSVVDTTKNAVIGDPLIYFPVYASNSMTIPPNNTAFSVTLPDVSAQCGTAGVCALQWFWDAPDVNQTYESCVDFTMGGTASAPAPAASKRSVLFSA